MNLKDWLAVSDGHDAYSRESVIHDRLEDLWVDYLASLTDYEMDHPESAHEVRPEHSASALLVGFGYFLSTEVRLVKGME